MSLVTQTVRLIQAAKQAYAKKWSFLAIFLVIFFVTFLVLVKLDLVPDPTLYAKSQMAVKTPDVTLDAAPLVAATNVATEPVGEFPTKIVIPAIGMSVTVANPVSTDIEVLDAGLLHGAVRYPTSAELGTQGNVILFGHSSYLPIVNNQAYKTFDGIQKLKVGDQIMVSSSSHVYVYSVNSVVKADAKADSIPLSVSGSVLTLATCDSFGQKTDRFVVTATLVDSHLIGS
jgi:LPXTG-site transpeptidase (sortase) family protein